MFPRKRGGSDEADETLGEVGRVSVAKEARGLGLAKRLMSAAEAKAVEIGYKSLFLVTATNAAKQLYRKLGYKQVAVVAKRTGVEAHKISFEKTIGA